MASEELYSKRKELIQSNLDKVVERYRERCNNDPHIGKVMINDNPKFVVERVIPSVIMGASIKDVFPRDERRSERVNREDISVKDLREKFQCDDFVVIRTGDSYGKPEDDHQWDPDEKGEAGVRLKVWSYDPQFGKMVEGGDYIEATGSYSSYITILFSDEQLKTIREATRQAMINFPEKYYIDKHEVSRVEFEHEALGQKLFDMDELVSDYTSELDAIDKIDNLDKDSSHISGIVDNNSNKSDYADELDKLDSLDVNDSIDEDIAGNNESISDHESDLDDLDTLDDDAIIVDLLDDDSNISDYADELDKTDSLDENDTIIPRASEDKEPSSDFAKELDSFDKIDDFVDDIKNDKVYPDDFAEELDKNNKINEYDEIGG